MLYFFPHRNLSQFVTGPNLLIYGNGAHLQYYCVQISIAYFDEIDVADSNIMFLIVCNDVDVWCVVSCF